mgnify:FL=1
MVMFLDSTDLRQELGFGDNRGDSDFSDDDDLLGGGK